MGGSGAWVGRLMGEVLWRGMGGIGARLGCVMGELLRHGWLERHAA